MGFRLMEKDKERIVNALADVILSDFEKIDQRSASQLKKLLKNGRVYFVLNPETEVLKRELIKTRYGETVSETHGMTTTYYLKGSRVPVVSFITLPEERLFGKRGNKIFLKIDGVETLAHEMSHLMYPAEKAERIVAKALGKKWLKAEPKVREKVAAETIADIFTVEFLLRRGRKKEAKAYLSGRTFTKEVRKKIVENALKQARKRKKEEYAAQWEAFLRRAKESKVKKGLLPKEAEKRGAERKAKTGLLKKLLRR